MRILQVFDLMSPLHGGGTVDVISKLSHGLAKRGHDITICTSDYDLRGNFPSPFNPVKIDLHHNLGMIGGIYFTPEIFNVDVRKYDVIHFHCLRSFQNAVLCQKARKYGKPYIIDAHGSTVNLKGLKQSTKWLYDKVWGYKDMIGASRLIAETEVGAKEYMALGAPRDKISLIHPPFDIKEFVNLPQKGLFREKYQIPVDKNIVLFIGRINAIKGLDFLVRAFAQFPMSDNSILVIVGADDGYKKQLEFIIGELEISHLVLFTGQLSGQDKLSALVDADVLVQPSKHEAGARPSFEAILCNTPVIATKKTGAGADIYKAFCGQLVEYGNTQDLSDAIKFVFDNQNKPIQLAQINNGKSYIHENLTLDTIVSKYEQLYREILK